MRYLLLLIPLSLTGCSIAMVKPLAEKKTADIGGPKLEYVMAGEGNPVIVFLSGYGADIDTSWGRIFPEVKTISMVFAYNRFNYGKSDKVDVPQTGTEIIANLLPMKEWVCLLEKLGLNNVKTYIQSGNAVFQSKKTGASELSDRIGVAIRSGHGFAPHVIILKWDELKDAVESNPYPKAESEPKTLHLTFLASVPESPDLITLQNIKKDSERFALKGKIFYLHAPEGIARSKLFARIEKSLGMSGTARNWRSVSNIKSIAEQMG